MLRELGAAIDHKLLQAPRQSLPDFFRKQAHLFSQIHIGDGTRTRNSRTKFLLPPKVAEQFALRAIVANLTSILGTNKNSIQDDDIDVLKATAKELMERFKAEMATDKDSADWLLGPLQSALTPLATFSPEIARLLTPFIGENIAGLNKQEKTNAVAAVAALEEKENVDETKAAIIVEKRPRGRPRKITVDETQQKLPAITAASLDERISPLKSPPPVLSPTPSFASPISSVPSGPVLSPPPALPNQSSACTSLPLPVSKRAGLRAASSFPSNLNSSTSLGSPSLTTSTTLIPAAIAADPSLKSTVREVWTHRDRLPEDLVDTHCFVCRQPGADAQCGKKFSNSTRCRTRFHLTCLKEYNASDFDAEYIHDSFGYYVCPLHHCNICWFERLKTSAVCGDVIQCKECYRSFHEVCQPAGFFVEKRVPVLQAENTTGRLLSTRIDMTVCHSHSKDKEVRDKIAAHLPFCCECEEKGQKSKGDVLIHCSECIRSFHPNCKRLIVKNADGIRFANNDKVCEACIFGECIRPNQAVISKYGNSFYPGIVTPLSKYPKHCAIADKYGSRLGNVGFVSVEWSGCQNLFSLIPARLVVPMFEGSYDLIGYRMSDKDIREAWEKMDSNIVTPRPHFQKANEPAKHKEIKTSFYQSEEVRPKGKLIPEEDMLCECAEGEGRCGDNCSNRIISQQECPKSCELKQGGCNNRTLSRSIICKKISLIKTEKKGMGVVATQLIKKDEFIAEYAGEIISEAEMQRRTNELAAKRNDEAKHYTMLLKEPKRYIDAKFFGNVARFINHSCEPNCRVDEITIVIDSKKKSKASTLCQLDARIAIVAKRDIQPNEELSFDYDMEELDEKTPLPPCFCGAPSCTGKLGKTKKQRLELAKKKQKIDEKKKAAAKGEKPRKKKTGRKRKHTEAVTMKELKKEVNEDQKEASMKRKKLALANGAVPALAIEQKPQQPQNNEMPLSIPSILKSVSPCKPIQMTSSPSKSPRKSVTAAPSVDKADLSSEDTNTEVTTPLRSSRQRTLKPKKTFSP